MPPTPATAAPRLIAAPLTPLTQGRGEPSECDSSRTGTAASWSGAGELAEGSSAAPLLSATGRHHGDRLWSLSMDGAATPRQGAPSSPSSSGEDAFTLELSATMTERGRAAERGEEGAQVSSTGANFFASPPTGRPPAAPGARGRDLQAPRAVPLCVPHAPPSRRIAYKSKTLSGEQRAAYAQALARTGLSALPMRAAALVMAPLVEGGHGGLRAATAAAAAAEIVTIGSHFARGGFGKVHPALLPDGRPVAAKQLRGEELRLRDYFRQQARGKGAPTGYSSDETVATEAALLRLNISEMRLYGVVETVDRRHYLLTSLMAGCAHQLNNWLWAMRPAAPVALGLAITQLAQVAVQLRRMHDAHGLVHRDIKPENLLVRAEAPHGFVIGDLGMATPAVAGAALLSTGGSGTWEYMSPERWRRGESYSFDSDLFSLGAAVLETALGTRLLDTQVVRLADAAQGAPRNDRRTQVGVLQDAWAAWHPGTFANQPALLAQVPPAARRHFDGLRHRLDALDTNFSDFVWRRLLSPTAAGRADAWEAHAWSERRLLADPTLGEAAHSALAAFVATDLERPQQFAKLQLFRHAKSHSLAS